MYAIFLNLHRLFMNDTCGMRSEAESAWHTTYSWWLPIESDDINAIIKAAQDYMHMYLYDYN